MSAKRDIGRRAAPLWIADTALLPVASHAEDAAEKWQWRASIYGWFPAIDGSTQFPSGASGPSIGVDASSIIENLKFTAMGTLEGRKGRWGFWTDVIYLNVGGDKSASRDATVGRMGLPAGDDMNADLNIKSWVWTLAGSYAISSTPRNETKFGMNSEGCIDLYLSKQDLASYTGTTYETLFRIMNEMTEEAAISVDGKKITIHNLDLLHRFIKDE